MRKGANGSFLVLRNHQHTSLLRPPISRPEAVYRLDPKAEIGEQVDPVDSSLEEGAASCRDRVASPSAGRLVLRRVELDETRLAQQAGADDPAQGACERFIAVVLGHQHPAAAPHFCGPYRGKVGGSKEGRLLHDHVLAVVERGQSQLQV